MPQAIKRFYGGFSTSSSYTTVYTCPANTIAKVKVNGLSISNGRWCVHTTTTSSNTYGILGVSQYEGPRHFTGFGDKLVLQAGSYSQVEAFPVGQFSGDIDNMYFREFNEGRSEYTAGTNNLKAGHTGEWYMSPSQKLFFYSFGTGYSQAYDFLIVEEAGS